MTLSFVHTSMSPMIQAFIEFLTTLSGFAWHNGYLPPSVQDPFDGHATWKNSLPTPTKKVSSRPQHFHHPFAPIQRYDLRDVVRFQVDDLVKDVPPRIQVDVVLISGQRQCIRLTPQSAIDTILQLWNILVWFYQNLPKYFGSHPARHPTLASFHFAGLSKG